MLVGRRASGFVQVAKDRAITSAISERRRPAAEFELARIAERVRLGLARVPAE
jgi:hypothetical protein